MFHLFQGFVTLVSNTSVFARYYLLVSFMCFFICYRLPFNSHLLIPVAFCRPLLYLHPPYAPLNEQPHFLSIILLDRFKIALITDHGLDAST
jgi:hypothetical protein